MIKNKTVVIVYFLFGPVTSYDHIPCIFICFPSTRPLCDATKNNFRLHTCMYVCMYVCIGEIQSFVQYNFPLSSKLNYLNEEMFKFKRNVL